METIVLVTMILTLASALVGLMVACGQFALVILQVAHEVIRIIQTIKNS